MSASRMAAIAAGSVSKRIPWLEHPVAGDRNLSVNISGGIAVILRRQLYVCRFFGALVGCSPHNPSSVGSLFANENLHVPAQIVTKAIRVTIAPNAQEALPRFVVSKNNGSAESRGKTIRVKRSSTAINGDDTVGRCDAHHSVACGSEPRASKYINRTRRCSHLASISRPA